MFGRKPYLNLWIILGLVFLIWHATYAWIFAGVEDGALHLGDDATVALLTGVFTLVGALITVGNKFVPSTPSTDRPIYPNLLFCAGIATIMTLEVVALAARAFTLGQIDLKGVVIGMVLSGIFGVMGALVGLGSSLVEET